MEKAELMQEKIEQQRKLPTEIKEKLNNITFINLIISIGIMVYLLAINILYLNSEASFFINSIKVLAIVLGIIDIILFEIAYRKDKISFWIYALELLCTNILILMLQYIYVYMPEIIKNIIMFSPVFFAIYYVAKTIIIHVAETKKYQNNLSDVREIVKEDVEGYLEEVDEIIEEVKIIEEQKKIEKKQIKEAKKAKKKGDL